MEDIFEIDWTPENISAKEELINNLESGNFRLSFSALSAFAVSPRAFIAYKLQERKQTPAMVMGELVHAMVLEPDSLDSRFFVAPEVSFATKEGKAVLHKMYCDFVEDCEAETFKMKKEDVFAKISAVTGVQVITNQQLSDANIRAGALINNRASRYVLNLITKTESKLPEGYKIDGIEFTGRIDGWGPGVLGDIKNMPDASFQKAAGSIWSRRLNWQAAIYDDAMGGGHTYYIPCVDGSGEVSVHAFSEIHLIQGMRSVRRYIFEFKRAIFEGRFDRSIWDCSQDFWLRSSLNENGINFL